MEFVRAHKMNRGMAKGHIESRVPKWREEFKDAISNPLHSWQGDIMHFSFRARGFAIKGRLKVNETHVELEVDVPLLLRPVEGVIRPRVEAGLKETFPD